MSSGQDYFALTPSNSGSLLICTALSEIYRKQIPYSQFIFDFLSILILWVLTSFCKSRITCRSPIFKFWIFSFTLSCTLIVSIYFLLKIFYTFTSKASKVNPYIFWVYIYVLIWLWVKLRKEMLKEENWNAYDTSQIIFF